MRIHKAGNEQKWFERIRIAEASAGGAAAHHTAPLNTATALWRLPADQSERILALLSVRGEMPVGDLAAELAGVQRDHLMRHLVWMCKVGLLDWVAGELIAVDAPDGRG